MEKDALAQQEKIVLEAQAEAESIRLKGESRAYAIEVRAKVISLLLQGDTTKLSAILFNRKLIEWR